MFKMKVIKAAFIELFPLARGKKLRISYLAYQIKNCTSSDLQKKLCEQLEGEDVRFAPLDVKFLKYQTLIMESKNNAAWVYQYWKTKELQDSVIEFYESFDKKFTVHVKIEPHI